MHIACQQLWNIRPGLSVDLIRELCSQKGSRQQIETYNWAPNCGRCLGACSFHPEVTVTAKGPSLRGAGSSCRGSEDSLLPFGTSVVDERRLARLIYPVGCSPPQPNRLHFGTTSPSLFHLNLHGFLAHVLRQSHKPQNGHMGCAVPICISDKPGTLVPIPTKHAGCGFLTAATTKLVSCM